MNELILAIFPSIHDVMAVEALLIEHQIWLDLIPKPTSISSDCGMAILLQAAQIHQIAALLRQHSLTLPLLYQTVPHTNTYQPVTNTDW
jgi:hypothetical protein